MANFARIDEAFRNGDQRSNRRSSASSSESLRKNTKHRQQRDASLVDNVSYERDFNENYQVKDSPKLRGQSSNYLEDTRTYVSNYDYGNTYKNLLHTNYVYSDCMNLVNQVLQNETCKRILRNILLDEYLDNQLN